MKITTAENNPDMELLTQQTFSFSPDDLAWAKKNESNHNFNSLWSGQICLQLMIMMIMIMIIMKYLLGANL